MYGVVQSINTDASALSFRLRLSTRAIAETEEAIHLIEQKERLEAAIQAQDSALSIDLSKAFLESIFKTIISDRLGKVRISHMAREHLLVTH